jgi:hypothetical protein
LKFGFSSGTGILEMGIILDLVLKPELGFFANNAFGGKKSSSKSVRDI